MRTKASTVQQAINLLGSRTVKYFLLTTGMKSALQARQSKLINLKNFWANNLERALFAREVARMLRADTDLAFAGAMLQDSLLPILSNELYDIYVKYCEIPEESPVNITAFEEKPQHPTGTLTAIALYSYSRDTLSLIRRYIAEGNNPDQPGRLVAWLHTRVPCKSYRIDGDWLDIGSPESYAQAQELSAFSRTS